jgi:hypothetical protein
MTITIYGLILNYGNECIDPYIFNSIEKRYEFKINWIRDECDDLHEWAYDVGVNLDDLSDSEILQEYSRLNFLVTTIHEYQENIDVSDEYDLSSNVTTEPCHFITYNNGRHEFNPYENITIEDENVILDLPGADGLITLPLHTVEAIVLDNSYDFLDQDRKDFWQEFLPVVLKVANDKIKLYKDLGFPKW